MLDDLSLFVSIVEAGSLSAAAEKEALPTATVTRRLQALERRLGYRLLARSARRMQLTAEGLQYYEQCRPLIHGLRQATQRLDAMLGAVEGNIRVLAPINLASGPLTPAWASFMKKYPNVSVELVLSNAVQDLVGSGADLAIRVGALQDSALMQRRLGTSEIVMVAAPSYLRAAGAPDSAEALRTHSLIVFESLRNWTLRDPQDNTEIVIQPHPRFRVNEMGLAVAMAEAGLGILLCPSIQAHAGLAAGTLAAVLPDWMPEPRQIYAVWSQQRYLPARVRALLEHLAEFIGAHPLLKG
ncbi:MAG TPA: LysR family transcriptional regulator [Noviherbaspirillum sp.]|nr:LysR family transcriptional regulator [Noviherbaspirillum sp.]